MKPHYGNPDHRQEIAWEALAYHQPSPAFLVTAAAALAVAADPEGAGSGARDDRAPALRMGARSLAAAAAEGTARAAVGNSPLLPAGKEKDNDGNKDRSGLHGPERPTALRRLPARIHDRPLVSGSDARQPGTSNPPLRALSPAAAAGNERGTSHAS